MTKSIVTHIGESAYFEDYPLLVLFNEDAPEELKDICVLHRFIQEPALEAFKAGATFMFDQEAYSILKVGSVAFENFKNLGHICLQFGDDPAADILPGTVLLDRKELPRLKAGSLIEVAVTN
ncbi:PTS sorbitol transporter subunit IIA [Enterococcus florum]|uniref:PTS sorbitol transporter subunit IIA n=1 Tax=Enterococcus florum TaxID=2480627 RepID=A0A4P5PH91_9ENTE|nr:PTS glucitol/sorbitol transporter subunit IIA [Enterococcus florum]GCF95698.1 PTS sorbitol transporter subunit IIA [Enterococcus florum]